MSPKSSRVREFWLGLELKIESEREPEVRDPRSKLREVAVDGLEEGGLEEDIGADLP